MKPILPFIIPFVFFLVDPLPSRAGLVVTDPTLIATNKAHHVKDLAEQLIRKGLQEKQLQQLLHQITQMQDYLERYGDPGAAVAVPELQKLIGQLLAKAPSRSSDELNRGVDGTEVFKESSGSIYKPTPAEIVLDDDKTVERNPDLYREDAAARRGFEHYRTVREEVLQRRAELRESVASTTSQLQAAATESEVRKLNGVLVGLQIELNAIDQEVQFASAEIIARHLEAEAERRLRAKAQLEEDRARHREATRKDAKFYQLLTEPTYFRSNR